MNEASKTMLMNAVKEWTKFVNERERMRGIATEVSVITQKVVLEALNFMKSQNVEVECQDVGSMKVMGHPVVIEPVIDAIFPNVKTKVNLSCSGATRSIVINPNSSISAGGNPFMFDQFKKGIPDSFVTNAAEFVSDAFLFIARSQAPEEQAPAQQQAQPSPAAAPQATPPAAVHPPAAVEAAPRTAPAAPQQPKPAQTVPPVPKPAQAVPQQPRPPQPATQQPRPPQPGQPPKPPGQKPPGT